MALSTSLTQVTRAGLSSFQNYEINAVTSVGVATFSNFKTGSTNIHSVGVEAAGINVLGGDTPIGTGATIFRDGGANFSGIVSATTFSGSFTGDGQNLTGLPAGLGTALSNTQTLALNKLYFTDKVLSISTTTTVDPPASASIAYTQYTDIKIEDGHDLIIRDGDELRPDVLGLSTTKTLDTNNFPDGLRGNLIGNVTGDVTGNVTGDVTGNVTGNLTGTASTSTNAAIAYAIDSAASLNTSGSITASSFISNSGTTIQRQFKYLTNTGQLAKGGGISELNQDLRIDFTPKFASSNLLMEFDTSYVSPNTTNLYYCLFYDVTNSTGVSIPAAVGSRVRCHWTKRSSPNDVNDNDHLSMRIVTPANNTTARTYTIHFGSEGAVAQFFVSTLSSAAGSTYPMTFTITEIAA